MLINEIANLPDVSFIDNITLDDVQAGLVSDYEKKYKEITGKDLQLHRADPEMLKLYACSIQLYQMFLLIDKGGKMCTVIFWIISALLPAHPDFRRTRRNVP